MEDRPKIEYLRTDAGRGKKTEGCLELDALPVLKVVPKAVSQTQLSAPSCKARRAALALWQKARTILALLGTEPAAPAALHRIALAPEETRSWRRGESKHDTGKERDYSEEEFCKYAVMLRDKQIKWTEYDAKYKEGEVRVPAATFRRYIYGRYKNKLEARLAGGGALKKGPQRGMLTADHMLHHRLRRLLRLPCHQPLALLRLLLRHPPCRQSHLQLRRLLRHPPCRQQHHLLYRLVRLLPHHRLRLLLRHLLHLRLRHRRLRRLLLRPLLRPPQPRQ